MSFKESTAKIGAVLAKNSPVILTATGIALGGITVYFAVKNTPSAVKKIDKAIEQKSQTPEVDPIEIDELGETEKKIRHYIYKVDMTPSGLRRSEIVKICWKDYLVPGVTGIAATACLIASTKISLDRCVTLASIYKLTETNFSEYKEKATKVLGEKKAKQVDEEIATERVKKVMENADLSSIVEYGDGTHDTYFVDCLTSQVIKSNWAAMNLARSEFSNMLKDNWLVEVNDWYEYINMRTCKIGEEVAFCSTPIKQCGYSGFNMSLNRTTMIEGLNVPAFVIDYSYVPKDIYYDIDMHGIEM